MNPDSIKKAVEVLSKYKQGFYTPERKKAFETLISLANSYLNGDLFANGLIISCDVCGKKLNAQGALEFSPPENGLCKKKHICKECYKVELPKPEYKSQMQKDMERWFGKEPPKAPISRDDLEAVIEQFITNSMGCYINEDYRKRATKELTDAILTKLEGR